MNNMLQTYIQNEKNLNNILTNNILYFVQKTIRLV